MTTDVTGTPAGATETVSAERVAADSGQVGAFLQHARDRRAGKAPADVTRERVPETQVARTIGAPAADAEAAPVVPGKDGAAAKGPKPADRDADERLTTRVREAVDTATAESNRRIRELEQQIEAARRTPAPKDQPGTGAAATPERKGPLTSAEIKRYEALPGAPKLDDKSADGEYLYDTAQQHSVALSEFIRETREAERADTTRKATDHVERVKREAVRATTFSGRIEAFKTANPTLLVEQDGRKVVPLSAEVGQLHGWAQLAQTNAERQARGLAPLPATVDHAIAEELYDSEIPMEIGLYLSTHAEELAALRRAQSPAQLTRLVGALEERVRSATKKPASADEAGATTTKPTTAADERREAETAVDRSVSSVRPSKTTLGRPGSADGGADPEAAAIAKDDIRGFLEVQRQRRLETLQGRQGARR